MTNYYLESCLMFDLLRTISENKINSSTGKVTTTSGIIDELLQAINISNVT